jgi:glycopeptide antibiotics resistance protein
MIPVISYALHNFINPYVILPGALVLIAVLWRWRNQYSLAYRVGFAVFWLYLMVLLSMTVFSGAVYRSVAWFERMEMAPLLLSNVNLIPFHFGRFPLPGYVLPDVLLNIAVTIPLGFGLNFFIPLRVKTVIWLAFGVGLFFEIGQLVVTLLVVSPTRAPDINDVLTNAAGVMIGYGLFWVFNRFWQGKSVSKVCLLP